MNNDINLLYNKKQQRLYRFTSKVRIIRLIALGFLFLVAGVAVLLFALEMFSPLQRLHTEEQTLTQTLSQEHEKILQQTLLSMRLSDISGIISKRSQYGETLKTLNSKLPSGVELDTFSVEGNKVQITVNATNLTAMQTYFDALSELTIKQKTFKRVYLNILDTVRNNSGQLTSFQAKLTITL